MLSKMVLNRARVFFVVHFFHLTLIEPCDNTVLPAPMAMDSAQMHLEISFDVQGELELKECPTWFQPIRSGNGTVSCECGSNLGGIVNCSHQTNSTQLLSPGYCMTTNHSGLGSIGTVVGRCPYDYIGSSIIYHYRELPRAVSEINSDTCDVLNRTGLLCAHCKDNLGPAVMSYKLQCLECLQTYKGLSLYIFLACFPTTLFFLLVVIFEIHATSPALNVIVFGSQILIGTIDKNIFQYAQLDKIHTLSRTFKLMGFTIAGFWNLDFFRYVLPPFCFSRRLTNIHVLALDYTVAIYPLALITVIYIIIELHARNCRVLTYASRLFFCCLGPCKKRALCTRLRDWDPKANIVHAFSTFLLLSYSKLLYVSFNLLASTKIYNMNGTDITPAVLYYDATIPYFSNAHRPFALLAISVLCTLVAFPPLLLLLYPTKLFQKCLGCCSLRLLPLHAFVDTFQGYYKNGTDGSRDYRSFSGIYLILRILFLTMNLTDVHYNWVIGIVCPMTVSLLFALLRPYKYNWYNVLDCLSLALLALFEFCILYCHTAELITVPIGFIYAIAAFPVVYFIICLSHKILKYLGLLQKCKRKLTPFMRQLVFRNMQQLIPEENTINDEFPHRLENPGEYHPLAGSRAEDPKTGGRWGRAIPSGERDSHDSYGSFY